MKKMTVLVDILTTTITTKSQTRTRITNLEVTQLQIRQISSQEGTKLQTQRPRLSAIVIKVIQGRPSLLKIELRGKLLCKRRQG